VLHTVHQVPAEFNININHYWNQSLTACRNSKICFFITQCNALNHLFTLFTRWQQWTQLVASAFNQLDQYANSPGHRAYSYAELIVFFNSGSITIASAHFAYSQRDDQAELAWVAWLNTEVVCPRTVTHLSTNLARCRVTLLMCPTTLPLSRTTKKHEQKENFLKMTNNNFRNLD